MEEPQAQTPVSQWFVQSSLYSQKDRFKNKRIKGGAGEQLSLFSMTENGELDPFNESIKVENKFTGEEIEIIQQVFKRAGWDKKEGYGKSAYFKSFGELGGLAFKVPSDKLTGNQKQSLKSVFQPRPIFFNKKIPGTKRMTTIVSIDEAPLTKRKIENGVLEIKIHSPWIFREIASCIYIPDGISHLLKTTAELTRVETPLVKLVLWAILTMRQRNWKDGSTREKWKIYEAIGVSHYFNQRNGRRAKKTLLTGLEALKKCKIISEFRELGNDMIQFSRGEYFLSDPETTAELTSPTAELTSPTAELTSLRKSNIRKFPIKTGNGNKIACG